jgi:hypothetical protein
LGGCPLRHGASLPERTARRRYSRDDGSNADRRRPGRGEGRDHRDPWKLSQQLRGELISEGQHPVADEFAKKGTSAPVVLDRDGKEALLHVVWIRMQVGSDEDARNLLPLRNALRADVSDSAV